MEKDRTEFHPAISHGEIVKLDCGKHDGVRSPWESAVCYKCNRKKRPMPKSREGRSWAAIVREGQAPSKRDVKSRAKRALDVYGW